VCDIQNKNVFKKKKNVNKIGHTDNEEVDEYNLALSNNRAESVKKSGSKEKK